MTPTEEFLTKLCKETFLSFWSFPTPFIKKGKELCDLLVVCDPDVVIFSVKEIKIKESGNTELDIDRWKRKALDESFKQIYGAERIINLKHEIFLDDLKTIVQLPKNGVRNVYRIAVAFGRGDKFPLIGSDSKKGFIHVFDEKSIQIVLQELDTITDFIDFLQEEERFIESGTRHIAFSEEDMLALYFQYGFTFPENSLIYVSDDLWAAFTKTKEYKKEKRDNKISYLWDGIIEQLHEDFINGRTIYGSSRDEIELSLRQMNKENRFQRRRLSVSLSEVIGKDDARKTPNSRIIKEIRDGAPVYVFLTRPFEHRDSRLKELQLRCLIAKQMYQDSSVFVGIATEKYKRNQGFSIDLCYFHLPEWNDVLDKQVSNMKEELGMYKNVKQIRLSPDGKKQNM